MIREHGSKPFNSIFVHGGPGAAGDLYDMCEVLGEDYGILETLHKGLTIDEQIEEVNDTMKLSGVEKATLLGHSWGAWLVVYYAAQYPEVVNRIILLSSGPFEEKYLSEMNRIRNERFTEEDLMNLRKYFNKMNESTEDKANEYFQKAGKLFHKTDSFSEEEVDLGNKLDVRKNIYDKIWAEAAEKRKNGELMKALKKTTCPIIVIHGDYDPHPYEGVKNPLLESKKEAEFFLLKNCGHNPWREKDAKNKFYTIMRNIIE